MTMLYNLTQILAFSKLFFNNKKSERKTEFEHTLCVHFRQTKTETDSCLEDLLDRTCKAVSTSLQLSVICTFNTKWQQTLAGSMCACVSALWS